MADNKVLAQAVLQAVGGNKNVKDVSHCMTRLRFRLNDESAANSDEEIKKIAGVLGVVRTGGQVQVIIGPQVAKVYDELCALGGFAAQAAIEENLDAPKVKEKLTPMGVINKIVGAMAGCLTPLIPVLLCCGMFKMLASVFGPQLLNVLSAESTLYTLFTFVGDAGFYFMPIIIGYTAARQFGMTPVMGMLMGAILVHPTLVGLAGQSFDVYGIPTSVQSYASTMFPIFLTVWLGAYVEKFFRKHIPDAL